MTGQNIRYLRDVVLGMTLRFMAEKLNYTETAVYFWETDKTKPSYRAREILCHFFNRRIPGLKLTPTRLEAEDLSDKNDEIQGLLDHRSRTDEKTWEKINP